MLAAQLDQRFAIALAKRFDHLVMLGASFFQILRKYYGYRTNGMRAALVLADRLGQHLALQQDEKIPMKRHVRAEYAPQITRERRVVVLGLDGRERIERGVAHGEHDPA